MATLSLCMIVKNEEKVLGRVLNCVKNIVDEIVIVDTGSEDSTKNIAFEYTDRVYDYEWRDDFGSARNFATDKATMDYWMWLDADDFINDENIERLKNIKYNLLDEDIVMAKYSAGFDERGKANFVYYRERIMKNDGSHLWQGKVHEAINLVGKIVYSDFEIEHRKIGQGDSDRNLRIYSNMIKTGEKLEPRHQFYYGRELYYHKRYAEAIKVLEDFLGKEMGWKENLIEACSQIAFCYESLGNDKGAMVSLLKSFVFDKPRAEICCEIGRLKMKVGEFNQAIYWYECALRDDSSWESGAFIREDCRGYIPFMQLCVCYDRLGNYDKAYEYHKRAEELKPYAEAVKYNRVYFGEVKGERL